MTCMSPFFQHREATSRRLGIVVAMPIFRCQNFVGKYVGKNKRFAKKLTVKTRQTLYSIDFVFTIYMVVWLFVLIMPYQAFHTIKSQILSDKIVKIVICL